MGFFIAGLFSGSIFILAVKLLIIKKKWIEKYNTEVGELEFCIYLTWGILSFITFIITLILAICFQGITIWMIGVLIDIIIMDIIFLRTYCSAYCKWLRKKNKIKEYEQLLKKVSSHSCNRKSFEELKDFIDDLYIEADKILMKECIDNIGNILSNFSQESCNKWKKIYKKYKKEFAN